MNADMIVQLIAVAVVVAICVAWVIKRVRHGKRERDHCSSSPSGECGDCPLASHCKK